MELGNNAPPSLPPEVQLRRLDELPFMRESAKDPDDPDNNWAARTPTINLATTYLVVISIMIFGYVATVQMITLDSYAPSAESSTLLLALGSAIGLVFLILVGIFGVVLFSLTVEADLPRKHSCVRWILRFVIIAFSGTIFAVWFVWGLSNSSGMPLDSAARLECWAPLVSAAGLYILFAITYRVWGLLDIKALRLTSRPCWSNGQDTTC